MLFVSLREELSLIREHVFLDVFFLTLPQSDRGYSFPLGRCDCQPIFYQEKFQHHRDFTGLLGRTCQAQRSGRMSFTIKDYQRDDFLGTLVGMPPFGI